MTKADLRAIADLVSRIVSIRGTYSASGPAYDKDKAIEEAISSVYMAHHYGNMYFEPGDGDDE